MWALLALYLQYQILSVFAESKLVRIKRFTEEHDSFSLPGSYDSCSRQNKCNRFNANLSSTASDRSHCSCSCSRQKAATFGVKNGYWQCIDNKEIRQRELSDCERIHFIDETDSDLLRVFKAGGSAALNISSNTQSFVNAAELSYQACNGEWTPLNNTTSARGIQVTKQWASAKRDYLLKVVKARKSLQGNVIKLAIPRGPMQENPFCLLFKVAGVMRCPLQDILATGMPLTKTTTTTTTTTTKVEVHSQFSEAGTPTSRVLATKLRKSQTIPTTTKVPKATFKVTHPWDTDGGDHTLNEASAQVSIPLIAGTAGISGIVLSAAFFLVLFKCRKEKKRRDKMKRHMSSTALELKATKPADDSTDHHSVVDEKAPYQSLSPSSDGVIERGVYVSRYNVPGGITANNSTRCRALHEGRDLRSHVEEQTEKTASDEYDYAESSVIVRNNLFKIDFPVSKKKASNIPKDNVPYYHTLEEGLQSKEPSESACGKPEESPGYYVLEGPNPLDSQGSLLNRDEGGAVVVHKETDPYYHILEGSTVGNQKGPTDGVGGCHHGVNSLDNEEYCGYKELKSAGRIPKDYQVLHKYAYVTIGKPKDNRYK